MMSSRYDGNGELGPLTGPAFRSAPEVLEGRLPTRAPGPAALRTFEQFARPNID